MALYAHTTRLAPPHRSRPPPPLAHVAARQPSARAGSPTAHLAPAHDPAEREADRIADAVIRGERPPAPARRDGGIRRKCAACDAAETAIRMKPAPGRQADTGAGVAAAAVSTGGSPLSADARAYFEPRFGRDLSSVRVHTDPAAARAAVGIGARAFAMGDDIAFASGEYAPETREGRRLIAHELAHVAQQETESAPVVRRMTYGAGTPPTWKATTLAVVPEDDRVRVDRAIAIADETVNDPVSYRECHDHFAKRCPGGTEGTLAAVWGSAVLWKITSRDPDTLARGDVSGNNIAYTQQGYNEGAVALASTLIHEAGHNCGIPGGDTHWRAEQIAGYCMGPGRNEFAIGRAGVELTRGDPLLYLSYRRFLGDWASGRLRATLGADLNVLGAVAEAVGPRSPTEIGSVLGGVQGRAGGWGGSRYGGFSFRVETGFGVGRFALRPAAPGETERTGIAPAWLLQVGPRAEFLVKFFGEGQAFPLSIGADYRLIQPLNSEAEALHALVFSIETRF